MNLFSTAIHFIPTAMLAWVLAGSARQERCDSCGCKLLRRPDSGRCVYCLRAESVAARGVWLEERNQQRRAA